MAGSFGSFPLAGYIASRSVGRAVGRVVGRVVVQVISDTSQAAAGLRTLGSEQAALGEKSALFGNALKAGALLAGIAFTKLAVDAGKAAVEFQTNFTKIVNLAGVSQDAIAGLEQQTLALAPAVGAGPNELADALYFVTSSGIPASKAMEVVKASAEGAAVGMGTTAQVADVLTSVMNAYGDSAGSAAEITATLIRTVRLGKAEATDLADTIGRVIPIAAQMGVTFQEVGGFIAAMTQTGFNAFEATTSLRQIMVSLLKPSAAAQDVLAGVGYSLGDLEASIRERGLLATLIDLKKRFGDNSQAMATVFANVRALTGVMSILGKNLNDVKVIVANVGKSTEQDLATAFANVSKTFGFQVKQIQADLEGIGIKVATVLLPSLISLGQAFTGVVKAIEPLLEAGARILGWIVSFIAGMTKINPLLGIAAAAFVVLTARVIAFDITLATSITSLSSLGFASAIAIGKVVSLGQALWKVANGPVAVITLAVITLTGGLDGLPSTVQMVVKGFLAFKLLTFIPTLLGMIAKGLAAVQLAGAARVFSGLATSLAAAGPELAAVAFGAALISSNWGDLFESFRNTGDIAKQFSTLSVNGVKYTLVTNTMVDAMIKQAGVMEGLQSLFTSAPAPVKGSEQALADLTKMSAAYLATGGQMSDLQAIINVNFASVAETLGGGADYGVAKWDEAWSHLLGTTKEGKPTVEAVDKQFGDLQSRMQSFARYMPTLATLTGQSIDEVTKKIEDMQSSSAGITDAIGYIQQVEAAWHEFAGKIAANYTDISAAFTNLPKNSDKAAAAITSRLQHQVNQLKTYDRDLQTLINRWGPKANTLIQYFSQAGLDPARGLHILVRETPKAQKHVIDLANKVGTLGQDIGETIAKALLGPMNAFLKALAQTLGVAPQLIRMLDGVGGAIDGNAAKQQKANEKFDHFIGRYKDVKDKTVTIYTKTKGDPGFQKALDKTFGTDAKPTIQPQIDFTQGMLQLNAAGVQYVLWAHQLPPVLIKPDLSQFNSALAGIAGKTIGTATVDIVTNVERIVHTTRIRHKGGPIGPDTAWSQPLDRMHSGGLKPDESLNILQSGEYVLRRAAVDRLGTTYLDRLNRGEQPGGQLDARTMAKAVELGVELAMSGNPDWQRKNLTVNVAGAVQTPGDIARGLDWWTRSRGWG